MARLDPRKADTPPGYDAPACCDALLHRFEDPTLDHRRGQIAMDGTSKIAVRVAALLAE